MYPGKVSAGNEPAGDLFRAPSLRISAVGAFMNPGKCDSLAPFVIAELQESFRTSYVTPLCRFYQLLQSLQKKFTFSDQ